MWSKAFWMAAIERAVKTFAQTAAALLVGGGIGVPMIGDLDWAGIASVSAIAALASLLTSVGSSAVTQPPGPSLTRAEQIIEPAQPVKLSGGTTGDM